MTKIWTPLTPYLHLFDFGNLSSCEGSKRYINLTASYHHQSLQK